MNEQKQKVAATFDLACDTYDAGALRCFDMHAATLVREAQVPAGASVLDVATGTGKVALVAARAVGPHGRVVGVDLSAGMLAQACRKTGALPVEFRRMDAEALEFDNETFDVVLCGFGVFFPPDMVRAVQEMRRVLRPGGRIAFSTWAKGAFEPMNEIDLGLMERYGIPRPPARPEGWMELKEPQQLLILLEKGDLQEGRVVQESAGYFIEPEDWWTFRWGTSARARLSALPPESVERLRRDILREIGALRTNRGIWLNTSVLMGIGVRGHR